MLFRDRGPARLSSPTCFADVPPRGGELLGRARRGLAGILAAHRPARLAPAARADPPLALGLLLVGLALGFLALAALQVAPVLVGAFILGSAGLLERDGDRLAAALDLAALARAAALELAMGIFVHDAAHCLALAF